MNFFTTYTSTQLFHEKPTFPVGWVKKTKVNAKIRIYTRYIFSFVHMALKILV
jgi:hypothetical protein